jgi:hypothetical protein
MSGVDDKSEAKRSRRGFIRSIASRTAFVAPLVASFSTAGLSFKSGEAMASNIAVPEPSSLALLAAGAVGVATAAGMRRKNKKDAAESE